MFKIVILVLCVTLCSGQQKPAPKLSSIIGNFSIELLYHTSLLLNDGENFNMSPVTVWSALASIANGANSDTRREISIAIRYNQKQRNALVSEHKYLMQRLKDTADAIQLMKVNSMFVDRNSLPLQDFLDITKQDYGVEVLAVNLTDKVDTAKMINMVVSNVTDGLVKKIVEPEYFQNYSMLLASALYFKGKWSVPFDPSYTLKTEFYDRNYQVIGEVNMMYKRFTFPIKKSKELQAQVIELAYGKEKRLSLIILLPFLGVAVEETVRNFQKVNWNDIFEELKLSEEESGSPEVDCIIPRFNIETDFDLTEVLMKRFDIDYAFDASIARFPFLARAPLHVSKVYHKTTVDVTEDGEVDSQKPKQSTGKIIRFEANRPFVYFIVEKETKTILFGGVYVKPYLY